MSGRDDTAYYWIRAAQELERAEQAANPTVAAVHHDLAYRYGARAAQAGSPPTHTGSANREDKCFSATTDSRLAAALAPQPIVGAAVAYAAAGEDKAT